MAGIRIAAASALAVAALLAGGTQAHHASPTRHAVAVAPVKSIVGCCEDDN